MSLQFYIGASGTGKSTIVYKEILKQAKKEPARRFFVIVPDQFTMQTQKVMCNLAENGGIMNVEVLSFGRLAHRVFEELGFENLPKLDDTGKNLILRKVAADCSDRLCIVGSRMKKVGYIAEIKSIISEFAQYGISPSDLETYCEKTEMRGSLSAKLRDVQILYSAYKKYIADKYITNEETIEILVKNLHKSKVVSGSVVVFDGFTGFTPIQDRLLQELMICTRRVIVTLLADSRDDLINENASQTMFSLTAKAYQKLCRLASDYQIERDEDVILDHKPVARYANNQSLAHLEASLFRNRAIKKVLCEQNVRLVHCLNPKTEADRVCLEIRRMIREKGYCYRDFAVITGDIESYGHILKESFEENAIPLFLDRNTSLLFHPLMVFLLGAIKVVVSNFSYESVMEFLRVGYLDLTDEQIDQFERYIQKKGVRGKARYSKPFPTSERMADVANEVRAHLFDVLTPLLQAEKDGKKLAGKKKKKQEGTIEAQNERMEASRLYVKAIYDICVTLRLEGKLQAMAKQFLEEGKAAKAKEYDQVFGAVIGLFDQVYALLNESMTLSEFGEILKAGFAELKVGSIPQSVDQVVAGDLERTRLKPVKVLFIIGANDGIIPGHGSSGGFLSDLERNYLMDLGVQLAPTARQKGFEERLYLYLNMTKPSEELQISFSEVDTAGGQLRPSYIVGVVKKLYSDLEICTFGDKELLATVESRESGLKLFTRLIREYVAGILEEGSKEWEMLFALADAFYNEPEFKEILSAAFFTYHPVPLSAKTAEALFGKLLHTSVSRLEQFSACAYAHFLKYGLNLREEEEYSFESADLGNLYHDTLYQFGKYLMEKGYSWFDYPKEEAEQFVEHAVDTFAESYHNEVLLDTARSKALKERTKDILNTSLDALTYQLRKGIFEPVCYELPFDYHDDPQLFGKIDRVDIAKDDSNVYVKILDYKSGDHSFDFGKVFYGLDLQLIVYLNAAVARQKRLNPDKNIVPSAIFYYQIKDPILESSIEESAEARQEKIRKDLCVKGLILEEDAVLKGLDKSAVSDSTVIPVKYKKDGSLAKESQTASKSQMDIVSQFANLKVKQIGEDIRNGKIDISPMIDRDNKSACQYCSYRHICGYEKKLPGYKERTMEINKDNACDEMRKELEDNGIYKRPEESHNDSQS